MKAAQEEMDTPRELLSPPVVEVDKNDIEISETIMPENVMDIAGTQPDSFEGKTYSVHLTLV